MFENSSTAAKVHDRVDNYSRRRQKVWPFATWKLMIRWFHLCIRSTYKELPYQIMLEVNHLGVSVLVEHKETIALQQMLGHKKNTYILYLTRVWNIIFLEIVRKINKFCRIKLRFWINKIYGVENKRFRSCLLKMKRVLSSG